MFRINKLIHHQAWYKVNSKNKAMACQFRDSCCGLLVGSHSTVNCSSNNAPCQLQTSTGPREVHCYTLYCNIVLRDPTVQLTVTVTLQHVSYKHRQDPQNITVTLCIVVLY